MGLPGERGGGGADNREIPVCLYQPFIFMAKKKIKL